MDKELSTVTNGTVSAAVIHAIDRVAEYVKAGLTVYIHFLAEINKKVTGFFLLGMQNTNNEI